jgi:hypothetical protein
MSYKVPAGAYPVNVTAVIGKWVTEALYKPGKILVFVPSASVLRRLRWALL